MFRSWRCVLVSLGVAASIGCGAPTALRASSTPDAVDEGPAVDDTPAPSLVPSPLVCSVMRAGSFAGDMHFMMGCPPEPRPVLAERPCARWGSRPIDHLSLTFGEDGLIRSASPSYGLAFQYDPNGRLVRIDGALQGSDVPLLVERDEAGVTYSLGDARRHFRLEGGLLSTYVVAFAGADGEDVLATWEISREAHRVVAEGRLGPHTARAVTTFDAQDRVQRFELDLGSDGTADVVDRFVWEQRRLVAIEHVNVAPTEIRYECETSDASGAGS